MKKGCKMSDCQKDKIRKALIGNKNRLGFKNSDDHNRKISIANKGKKLSQEQKK